MKIDDRLAASSITFRDASLEETLSRLRGAGFRRLDLTAIRHFCDHFDPLLVDVGEAVCYAARDLIAQYEMQAVSVTSYPANPLATNLNGDDWTSGVDAYVRLALIAGMQYLIFPPGQPSTLPEHWRGAAERVKPWQHDAAQRALNARLLPAFALQSNSLLRTSQQGIDFLHILNMMNVGLAVDPAHLAAMGEDPAEALRQMGNAVTFVVLRDTDGTNFNLPPGSGTLDYPGIMAALDDIGYDGPLVLAIDDVSLPAEDRVELLDRGREYLAGL